MADWGRGSSPSSVEQMLDEENRRMSDNLASKVTRLKSDSDFMSVTGLLTGSVKRFSTMARSGRDNRKLLCYVSAGLIGAFIVFYFLLSRTRT